MVLFVSLVVSTDIERLYCLKKVFHGCCLADENEYSFVDSGSRSVQFNSLVRSFSAIVICPHFSCRVSAAAELNEIKPFAGRRSHTADD